MTDFLVQEQNVHFIEVLMVLLVLPSLVSPSILKMISDYYVAFY